MSLETNRVKFGEFLFDAKEKVLLREGKPVSITPKAFELLLVLLENHGHLVEKNELMKAVWADSFVEEGNLTYTICLLRIVLDDEKQKPRFIETVPKRGYRFIAEVRETFRENSSNNGSAHAFSAPIGRNFADLFKKFLLPAVGVLIVGASLIGFWFVQNKNSHVSALILSAPFASEKLSTDGKVFQAAISPDGKNVVYTNGLGSDKQSVWLRQLESTNNVQIIPPSDDTYYGLALSPDGNFLYFTRRPKGFAGQGDIYRVSIFGGIPTKIASETQGWISVSPDGARISYVRCTYHDDEFCSLWIADALDGRNEKKLAARPRPVRIGDNQISPDGRSVAIAVGQSESASNEFGLVEVDIKTGAEREITTQKFFNIKHLAWLPDGSGLLLTASQIPTKNFRIWQVSAATGDVEPLTKDSESYSALSLDKAASRLVSTQVKQDFHLFLWQTENSAVVAPRILADAASVTFAPNGKIFFTSLMTGNDEIWSVNADGSGRQQLTNDAADDRTPVVSPDNNRIFFTSNRTGAAQIWRMNADSSNQAQITQKEGGYPLFVSTDGKWLYYQSALQKTLWRVSTAGGEEQIVLDKRKNRFAISPDGSQVAFSEKQGEESILMIILLADGQTVKTFKFADPKARLVELKWSPDGENLAYILADNKFEHNILWFQPLAKKTSQQIADLGIEQIAESGFALAPDGKSFAVAQGGWRHDAVLLKGLR